MESYRWIGPEGEEVEFPTEEELLSFLFSGRIHDRDLVRLPNSNAWVKARDLRERIQETVRHGAFRPLRTAGTCRIHPDAPPPETALHIAR